VQNHALQRHHDFVGAEAEEPAVGDHDEELLALRVLENTLDGAELLALVVVDLTALELGNRDLLLLGRSDGTRRLRLLADSERVASLTLLDRLLLSLSRLLLSLLLRGLLSLLLTRLLLGLLLHLLLAGLLLLAGSHALDADLRLAFLLLELHLRLAGTLEGHLRLGLFGADLRLRLLGLDHRLGLLDLNLRLRLRHRHLGLRHAHDDLGLRLLHDDRRRSLTNDDLRRLLLDIDLGRLLLHLDAGPSDFLLLTRLSLLLLAWLHLGLLLGLLPRLGLLLPADLDRLLILDRLELSLLLFAERLCALQLTVLHAMRDQLIALHVHAVDRQENLALILRHLDHDELFRTLAVDDAGDGADRFALLGDDLAVHQFTDRNFLQLTSLHLLLARLRLARLLLTRLLRLHLLLLRLTRLRLGLLCARRHGNHRRGTEERCK
jgi:hypothetical protein